MGLGGVERGRDRRNLVGTGRSDDDVRTFGNSALGIGIFGRRRIGRSIRGVSHAGPRQGGQAAGENGNMLDSRN